MMSAQEGCDDIGRILLYIIRVRTLFLTSAVRDASLQLIPESIEFVSRALTFEGIRRGEDADENQHDKPHSLLTIIGTMSKADSRAGEHEQCPDPPRWRVTRVRCAVKFWVFDQNFHHDQKEGGHAESDNRGNKQCHPDFLRLGPVDSVTPVVGIAHQGIGDTDPDDGADQGMGTGSRQAQIPCAHIPDDRRDKKRKNHCKPCGRSDMDDQFHRQKVHDTEGNGSAGGQDSQEVKTTGPDDCGDRRQRVCVNNGCHGIRRIVKSVHEFKGQGKQ